MAVKIFDYGMNGEGVGKLDGKIILVNNTLIGEDVEFKIIEDNPNFSIAKLTTITSTSKNRINPNCPHFNECGGCQLQPDQKRVGQSAEHYRNDLEGSFGQ